MKWTEAEHQFVLETLEEKPSIAFSKFMDLFGLNHTFASFCTYRDKQRKLQNEDLSVPFVPGDGRPINPIACAKARLLVKQLNLRIARQKRIAKCRAQRGAYYER